MKELSDKRIHDIKFAKYPLFSFEDMVKKYRFRKILNIITSKIILEELKLNSVDKQLIIDEILNLQKKRFKK